jgi:hypothetical protein
VTRIPTALLRDTATLELYVGENAYGSVGVDELEVPCRIEPVKRSVIRGDGLIAEAVAKAFVRCDHDIPPASLLTASGTCYTVLDVATRSGLTGPSFYELTLGRSEPPAASELGREEIGT